MHRVVSRLIYVLTGCTAVGKTELALRWAESRGAEIVSCDSLLFYQGMNIGTAKPTAAELARVPHHLIDICDVTAQMDVATYLVKARRAVEDITARGHPVLVTGGSGFYLKAFFSPIADEVEVAAELRAELRARLSAEGLGKLVDELRALNPAGLGALDMQNPRRVLRALERCRSSGLTLAVLQANFAAQPAAFADWSVELCELVRPPEELDQRIAQRVAQMMAAGLIEEVRALIAQGLTAQSSAARAIGYRETIDFIEGRLTAEALVPSIVQHTRALVKKQRTWFKTQLPAHRQLAAGTTQLGDLFG